MELTDRQNWILSTVVGVLLAANAVAWVPRADGLWDWATVIALTVGGLMAMANGVRALRDPAQAEAMEWTRRKTHINLLAVVVLTVGLAVQVWVALG
ncbi:MAG: hypothetical protein ABEJ85_04150 [Haloarculaceae archaeon]